MRVNKAVNFQLNEEDLEALNHGEVLTVSIDQEQGIHIYPPKAVENHD